MAIRKGGSPTGFVNLERYLQGNQGAGSQMVGAITQGLGQQEQTEAQKQAEQASRNIQTGIEGEKQKSENLAKQIQSNPASIAGDAQDYLNKQFSQSDVGAQQTAIKQQQKAIEQKIANISSEEGQQAALQQKFGKQTPYSSGFSALDQFLIGADPQARQTLEAKTQAVRGQVSDTTSKALADINKSQEKAKTQFQQQQQNLKNITSQKELELQRKINAEVGKQTSEFAKNKARKQLKPGENLPTKYTVATPEQLADLEALKRLTGHFEISPNDPYVNLSNMTQEEWNRAWKK